MRPRMQVAQAHKLLSAHISWDALNVYFAMHPYNLVHCAILPTECECIVGASYEMKKTKRCREVSAKCIQVVRRTEARAVKFTHKQDLWHRRCVFLKEINK